MDTFLRRGIEWLFYILFFLVPLIFFADTSELFEFNKMWFTFSTAIIIGVLWICRMIIQRRFIFTRTPIDIPVGLFLVSQVISTIFSLDTHTSLWGYYSRFNGGLFSIISYIFLYYALVSNTAIKTFITRLLGVTLLSGLAVCLWGIPSHFGHDFMCLLFRGTFDVACWTDAFQPRVRMFSTLGQPDWFSAYLAVLIPVALGIGYAKVREKTESEYIWAGGYFLLAVIFYVCMLWSGSRGGFIGLIAGMIAFGASLLWMHISTLRHTFKFLVSIIIGIAVVSFIIGTPFSQLSNFTLSGVQKVMTHHVKAAVTQTASTTIAAGELGGTDSGKIRLFVWQGALKAWMHYPIFGTGVETFAYAYYLYRPAGHNLTSEWDYLYNKAHNEYLNYLATTGAFGLLTYLTMIIMFLVITSKWLLTDKKLKKVRHDDAKLDITHYTIISILGGYITILVSNFFGFSVVILNIFLFVIPGVVFVLIDKVPEAKEEKSTNKAILGAGQYFGMTIVGLAGLYLLLVLANYWQADRSYGYGYNLDHAGVYDRAYQPLMDAFTARPGEPQFTDELSLNNAVLASAYATNKDATNAAALTQQALQLSDQTVTQHPNVVTFWKTRVRVMYALAQAGDSQAGIYLSEALKAIKVAHTLAPTDAKISYNYGLLLSQNGQTDAGIQELENTVKLKPDYRDAYFALGVLLHQEATNTNGHVTDQNKEQQAVSAMRYILEKIGDDSKTKDLLASWGEQP